jgi:hypothetical protein
VAPGVTINSVNYHITGPGGFVRDGSIDVSTSTTITAVLGGLPAGTGYTITLTASAADGGLNCLGSATFNVVARTTTEVTVHLTCQRPKNTGSVLVDGTLNICPVIDSVATTAPTNGVVSLSSSASDLDSKPSPLAYHWTINSGTATLANANAANTTLTCGATGPVSLTLTVTDGDSTAGCPDSFALSVSCVAATTTAATTVTTTTGAAGSGGAGGAGGGTVDAGPDSAAGAGGSAAGAGGGTVDAGPDSATGAGGSAAGAGGAGGSAAGSGGAAGSAAGSGGAGGDPNCDTCELAQCPDFRTFGDVFAGADRAQYDAVVACVRRTSCHLNNTLDCYCGSADATQCLATTGTVANGACKAEIEAGQHTTNPTAIQNQYTDIGLPAGAAMQLMLCDNAVCTAECIPYGAP